MRIAYMPTDISDSQLLGFINSHNIESMKRRGNRIVIKYTIGKQ